MKTLIATPIKTSLFSRFAKVKKSLTFIATLVSDEKISNKICFKRLIASF